jgi:hypothetical protein
MMRLALAAFLIALGAGLIGFAITRAAALFGFALLAATAWDFTLMMFASLLMLGVVLFVLGLLQRKVRHVALRK